MESIVEPLETVIKSNDPNENRASLTFELEHNVLAPMSVLLQTIDTHTLDLNIGKAVSLTSKKDSISRTSTCSHGDFAALVSPGENLELKWNPEFNVMRIIVSAAFVDRIIETDKVRFRTTANFEDPLLKSLADKLKNEKWMAHLHGTIYSESLAIAMVIHLASNYSRNGKKIFAPKGKLSSTQLNNLYEFTRSSINKNIKLSELATVVHMSEFHFARLFKQTTGISPYRFVLQLKIDQAKMLIKKEKKSCSDIAYMLNFSDQAHFSHVFKKVTGFSPRTFMNATA
jgi:AraC family transcriptional regulator